MKLNISWLRKAFLLSIIVCCANNTNSQSVDTAYWWKKNNLRVIQVNLPDYEAATLHPDSLLQDLLNVHANTLIINAGGIMSFYPTKLPFHYINPHMQSDMLGNVIKKCHQHQIKVMVRFDFSRVQESIYKQHPDWCYISPKGERIINTDMYVVSINAPYVQDAAFKIIEETISLYPVDGIFLNMPGYQTRNPYENKYHGIDQNSYDKEAFNKYSGGLVLPLEEKKEDPVFQKYLAFKKHTIEQWSERLYKLVKNTNPQIAICTYLEKHVDIIRHESQTSPLPYWPYGASDNVNNAVHSYPEHIISNASIQQISFQSRFNAAEPEEVRIRLYENIANGSGLDMSMMGDMRGYEDERNFEVFKEVYGFHKKNEAWFGRYTSPAKVALIAPGAWPGGEAMQEYRGIQLMLKEAHIPFDIIEDGRIYAVRESMRNYRAIILPDITYLNEQTKTLLQELCSNGTSLIATNKAFSEDSTVLRSLFGAEPMLKDNDGTGNYVSVDNHSVFKRLSQQTIVSWRYNLGMYHFPFAQESLLPIFTKGRPGPPEITGGHQPTAFHAAGIKYHNKGKAVLMPLNIGKIYYQLGFQQHKNIFLDLLTHVYPQVSDMLITNAPERVEMIPVYYKKNDQKNNAKNFNGMLLHFINLTGFSGNSYFKPLAVNNISLQLQVPFKPTRVYRLTDKKAVPFQWKNGILTTSVATLQSFETIVMDR